MPNLGPAIFCSSLMSGRVEFFELAAGNAHVGIGLLVVLVVFGHSQGLDEGQVARDDGGRGGDNAGRATVRNFIVCVGVCVKGGRRGVVSLEVVCMERLEGRRGYMYLWLLRREMMGATEQKAPKLALCEVSWRMMETQARRKGSTGFGAVVNGGECSTDAPNCRPWILLSSEKFRNKVVFLTGVDTKNAPQAGIEQ